MECGHGYIMFICVTSSLISRHAALLALDFFATDQLLVYILLCG